MLQEKGGSVHQVSITTDEAWHQECKLAGFMVVEAYASWCGPSSSGKTIYKKLMSAQLDESFRRVKVCTDSVHAFSSLAQGTEPTFFIYFNGQCVSTVNGPNGPLLRREFARCLECKRTGEVMTLNPRTASGSLSTVQPALETAAMGHQHQEMRRGSRLRRLSQVLSGLSLMSHHRQDGNNTPASYQNPFALRVWTASPRDQHYRRGLIYPMNSYSEYCQVLFDDGTNVALSLTSKDWCLDRVPLETELQGSTPFIVIAKSKSMQRPGVWCRGQLQRFIVDETRCEILFDNTTVIEPVAMQYVRVLGTLDLSSSLQTLQKIEKVSLQQLVSIQGYASKLVVNVTPPQGSVSHDLNKNFSVYTSKSRIRNSVHSLTSYEHLATPEITIPSGVMSDSLANRKAQWQFDYQPLRYHDTPHGILNHLNTVGNTLPYVNAAHRHWLRVTCSPLSVERTSTDPILFIDHLSWSPIQCEPLPCSCFTLDFGSLFRVALSHYAIHETLHGSAMKRLSTDWELLGSMQGTDWVTLHRHKDERDLSSGNTVVYSLSVNPTGSRYLNMNMDYYRYVRIMETGPGTNGLSGLSLGGLEIYGHLVMLEHEEVFPEEEKINENLLQHQHWHEGSGSLVSLQEEKEQEASSLLSTPSHGVTLQRHSTASLHKQRATTAVDRRSSLNTAPTKPWRSSTASLKKSTRKFSSTSKLTRDEIKENL